MKQVEEYSRAYLKTLTAAEERLLAELRQKAPLAEEEQRELARLRRNAPLDEEEKTRLEQLAGNPELSRAEQQELRALQERHPPPQPLGPREYAHYQQLARREAEIRELIALKKVKPETLSEAQKARLAHLQKSRQLDPAKGEEQKLAELERRAQFDATFEIGDTVRVSVRIREGEKERLKRVEGIVISRKGRGVGESFTVRSTFGQEGVESIFPVHCPALEKIEVLRKGRVRRAKLHYLRQRVGKARKVTERKQSPKADDQESP